MKPFPLASLMVVLSAGIAAAGSSTYSFDRDPLGACPAALECRSLGRGDRVHWQVKKNRFAVSAPNVLEQSGQAGGGDSFALALFRNYAPANGDVTLKFRSESGLEKPGAGIVWRFQGDDTYYLVYASVKDDMVQVIRVRKGKRRMIEEKQGIVTADVWHSLRLVFFETSFMAFLDGELVVGDKDSAIKGPGQIGIVTQADAVTLFDDVAVGADAVPPPDLPAKTPNR